jgi:hypothetical protein
MTVPAFAQFATGSIVGTVKDVSGAVIPGVTVTLSSAGVIGGNQQVITSERGTYEFTRLVPGTYSVKAELTGFRPSASNNLIVNADFTARGDLTLQVGNVADEVTVTGESPLLDTTSALNQVVLDRATLDNIPTGHDLWSIARTVPGVNVNGNGIVDVGGNNSFQQSTPYTHGSSGTDNKYAIDGLDVAWANGAGTVMVYFDPNMFEEINYQTANIGAESRQGGVVMNMVTKTGTNTFHGSYMFTGTNLPLQGNNLDAALTSQLSKQIPAVVLAANPNIKPGQQINSLFDTAASLSGPIVKDKFWFTTTMKISSLNQYVLGNYNPNGTQGLDDNRIYNYNFKASYQLSHSSQLHYTYSRNLKYRFHRRTTTYQEDAASRFQDQWADIHQLRWTDTLNSKLIADAGISLQVGPSPYMPNALAIANAAQGGFAKNDITTGASTGMNSGYNSEPQYRLSTNFNLSYFTGPHEVKVGYQLSRVLFKDQNFSIEDPTKAPLPGPFQAVYSNGAPNSITIYNYPQGSVNYEQEYGFFVQDKWAATRKLTLNLGVRVDHVAAWVPQECQPTTVWLNGQCFAAVDSAIPKLLNAAPRFSFIYDLRGDGRTAIKGAANIYDFGIDSSYPARVNPYSPVNTSITCWTDANKDGIPQQSEIGFNFATKTINSGCGSPFQFGNTNSYDPNLKRPFSAEYSIGLQHELPGGILVSGTYYHRDFWRTIGVTNTALSPDNWVPVSYTAPENGQVITAYSLANASFQALNSCTGLGACNVWSNHSDRGNYFNGVDFNVTKRMSNRWSVISGLSLGSSQTRKSYRPDNPNLNLFVGGPAASRGTLPGGSDGASNVPVSFRASGVFQAPYAVQVAGGFGISSGSPEQSGYQLTKTQIPSLILLSGSSLTVPTNKRGDTNLPAVTLANLSIGRDFKLGEGRFKIQPKMEFFNLFNTNVTTARSVLLNGTGSSAYLNPSTVVNARMLRLGIQTNF